MRLLTLALCSLALAATIRAESPSLNARLPNEIELDVVRDVVRSRFATLTKPPAELTSNENAGQLYFLTTTPTRDWQENGRWKSLPKSFHQSINDLSVELLPASDAYLVNRAVYRVKDGKAGWMFSVYVSKWISNTEVEVDQELHLKPQRGSGTKEIWIESDGGWIRKPGAPVLKRLH